MTSITPAHPLTPSATSFVDLTSDDPRSVLGRAAALAYDTIAAVDHEGRNLPTPCPDLDVRSMVGHLITVLRRVAALGEGSDPMDMPPTTHVADDAWADTWTSWIARIERAWTDDRLDTMMTLPWVTMPGRAMLAQYTNELSVHTWDLAIATGQQPAWDDDVLAVAFDAIRRGLPAEGRMERFDDVAAQLPAGVPFAAPFGPAVETSDTRPLIDRLVAWNGRTPNA